MMDAAFELGGPCRALCAGVSVRTERCANPNLRARRGLTMLEAVAAMAILGVLSATVTSAISAMNAAQDRNRKQLGAMELCNRLILQNMDDPDAMPDPSLPIAYGTDRYRWKLDTAPAMLTPTRVDTAAQRATRSALSIDRLEAISVSVWLSEESGGSFGPSAAVPHAQLARLKDPIADSYRNPDSSQHMLSTDEGKRRLLDRFRALGAGAGGAQPTKPGAPRPTGKPGETPNSKQLPEGKGGKGAGKGEAPTPGKDPNLNPRLQKQQRAAPRGNQPSRPNQPPRGNQPQPQQPRGKGGK